MHSNATLTSVPRELTSLATARRALAEASSLTEIKKLRDTAEAVRHLAQAANLGLEIQNEAAVLKLEAERRAGAMLAAMTKNTGQVRRGSTLEPRDPTPTLSDLGIGKTQSHRWQLEASVPEDQFRAYVSSAQDGRREITSAGLIKIAKQSAAQKTQAGHLATPSAFSTIDELRSAGTRFTCVYADPPWDYSNQATRAATSNHYPTMTIAELAALPIAELVDDNCHLHLWTTSAFLREAFEIVDAWGFQYRSCFVWVKPRIGLGNYWRLAHELLLFGLRGSLPFGAKDLPSWIELPTTAHSEKPAQIRELIERVSPAPRLELFARTTSPGWTAFGNQIHER